MKMQQIHGKTRRGRPPKYQQYWLSLAREKAMQRLKANGEGGQTNTDPETAKDTKTAEKDASVVEFSALKRLENDTPNWKGGKNIGTSGLNSDNQLKILSGPLKEYENEIRGECPVPNQCNFMPQPNFFYRNQIDQGLQSTECIQPHAKRFKQDVPDSNNFMLQNEQHSVQNGRFFVEMDGFEVPLFVTTPSQHTRILRFPNCELKPQEFKTVSNESMVYPQKPPVGTHEQSRVAACMENRTICHAGLAEYNNHTSDAEKNEYALDLSYGKSQNQEIPEGGEMEHLIPVAKPISQNSPEDSRHLSKVPQLRDPGQPWNLCGAFSKRDDPVYASSLGGLICHSISPLRPCSRLIEISSWNVDQVVHFISSIPGCQEYAECFRREDIDGVCLLQLSESHLRNVIRMKLGPSLHLQKAVDELIGTESNVAA